MSDPQQEYADARAAYDEALVRLREAKRHIPQSPKDRWRQRQREKREAERAHYLANKAEIDAQQNEWLNRITAKALAVLHQRTSAYQRIADDAGMKPGESMRIRLPITYRVITSDDEQSP